MRAVDILKAAKEKIATPDKWTQGAYAKDANGYAVVETSNKAACFCSLGAIYAANPRKEGTPNWDAQLAARDLASVVGKQSIVNWNDEEGRTHEEVLAAFDKAIERASS
jgi:hypothetical protein